VTSSSALPAPLPAHLSDLDSAHFGVRIARSHLSTAEELATVLAWCREQSVDMLVLRCTTASTALVNAAEREDFLLMDTLVYYGCELAGAMRAPAKLPASFSMRSAESFDANAAAQLAQACFHDYLGHYHADPRLDRLRCDQAYGNWAHRTCTEPRGGEQAFVGEVGGKLAAFAATRVGGETGEGLLYCVAPEFRRQGLYQAMLAESMARCRSSGSRRFEISTQISNLPSQGAWAKMGMTPIASWYTLHKWF
jgi:GNAT superfamily N-acetyltransferase